MIPTRHKYRAKQTVIDGIKFPSIKEAAEYQKLVILKRAGKIRDFRRQVPFGLKAKTATGREYRYILDYEIIQNDGTKIYREVKGMRLPLGELKRAMAEFLWDIRIEVV